ncbi:hypothetical protein [Sphingomonas sp.]|uniref:hypothetical protein n=1 Tax=Sphingomonas sp. TaxID=28214 RepID=UPI003BAD39F7
MAGIRGDIRIAINLTQTGEADLGTPRVPVAIDEVLSFIPGTAAVNQANALFKDTRTISASSNENLDLAGVLTDSLGATITAAEVVAIYIKAAAANTNSVVLTRPASNSFAGPILAASDGITLAPGAAMMITNGAGWGVTGSTGDLLNVANSSSGSSVSYDIVIVGRTTAA